VSSPQLSAAIRCAGARDGCGCCFGAVENVFVGNAAAAAVAVVVAAVPVGRHVLGEDTGAAEIDVLCGTNARGAGA